MSFITVGQENTSDINLYYEDHGSGPAVVLLSGWPLDSRSWEPQMHALLEVGHRVITYDRRGFGQSSRPTEGYDFDTLAGDLDKLLTELDLREVTLVGFSLGTGELARYIGTYGTGRLKGCVFIESLAPSFVKSDENPNGVDQATIDTVRQAILDDRPAWLTGLLGDFLNLDDLLGKRVSEETVRNNWNAGAAASPWATWACVLTWLEDFHEDIKRIDVPALILHGTADRILSVEGQGRRMHAALPDAHYVEIEGGPHVMCVTHAKEVNHELLAFLRSGVPVGASALNRISMTNSQQPIDALAAKLKRTELQHSASSIPGREIVQVLTEIPCGVESGWHIHPGEEIGYILAGTVQMMIQGQATRTLHAGDPFLMPPRTPHNALDVGPGTGQMLSTYIVDAGQPLATFVDGPPVPAAAPDPVTR
jgi:non-heme chloroperoxidase